MIKKKKINSAFLSELCKLLTKSIEGFKKCGNIKQAQKTEKFLEILKKKLYEGKPEDFTYTPIPYKPPKKAQKSVKRIIKATDKLLKEWKKKKKYKSRK